MKVASREVDEHARAPPSITSPSASLSSGAVERSTSPTTSTRVDAAAEIGGREPELHASVEPTARGASGDRRPRSSDRAPTSGAVTRRSIEPPRSSARCYPRAAAPKPRRPAEALRAGSTASRTVTVVPSGPVSIVQPRPARRRSRARGPPSRRRRAQALDAQTRPRVLDAQLGAVAGRARSPPIGSRPDAVEHGVLDELARDQAQVEREPRSSARSRAARRPRAARAAGASGVGIEPQARACAIGRRARGRVVGGACAGAAAHLGEDARGATTIWSES